MVFGFLNGFLKENSLNMPVCVFIYRPDEPKARGRDKLKCPNRVKLCGVDPPDDD
jgi:hypothetical protein